MSHSHDLASVIDSSERAGDLTPPADRRRAAVVLAALLLPILVATIAGLVLLWPSGAKPQSGLQLSATGVTFPQGKVTSLVRVPCGQADKARGCGTATVSVTEGAAARKLTGIPVPSEVVEGGAGTTVILTKAPGVAGQPAAYSFYDIKRDVPLVALAVLFAVVTIGVARLRGLLALLGLGFASVVVVGFILPALVDGKSPLWVGLTGASAIIFVVLYLAHGFSLRTTTALLGTFGGLALTALIGGVAVRAAHLSGISGDDNEFLARVAGQINPLGLLTCGIVLAGLGVLNDVTITQASAVWELREAAPGMAPRRLYGTAMRIGRDHIASTVYTIVFAYAGAALPVLLLIVLYGQPLASVITSSNIAEELVRSMASAIGLVLAVPLTTALAVAVASADRPRARHSRR